MRHTLNLLDSWHRPIAVEGMIRSDTVELRCRDHLAGVADRDYLRHWLAAPFGAFVYDDVTWLDLPNGVMLSIGDTVSGHILTDPVLSDLRAQI